MKRVLIVEDSPPLSSLIKEILEQNGYEVSGQALNGADSITMFSDQKPDLVLMDIMLPDMSGVDATKRIIEMDAKAKVIALTALSQNGIMEECMKAGCKAFLVKPFRLKELVDLMSDIVYRDYSD